MKAFWSDCGSGPSSEAAVDVEVHQAKNIASDISGARGNFFGFIDGAGNTIQFYFDKSIPNDVDDASHLDIVLMDFPCLQLHGSYGTRVTIGQIHGLIERAFEFGADYRQFGSLKFSKW
jgi:hypothetical protein